MKSIASHIRAAALAVFVLLAALWPGCARSPEETSTGQTHSAEVEERVVDPEENWTSWSDTLRYGDALWDLLVRHAVPVRDVDLILTSMEQGAPFSWRRLKPGEFFTGCLDETGALRRLLYQRSREEVYCIEITGDSLCVSLCPVAQERSWRRLQAVVNTSVDAALREVGADAQLVFEVARILSWDVDFFTDPRMGDTLDLVVEEISIDGSFHRFGDVQTVLYAGERIHTEGYRFQASDRPVPEYYDENGRNLRKTFLKSPLNYTRISSRFSHRRFHPILKRYRPHLGVDYAAPTGTPVVSVADGEVLQANWNGGYGRYVKIRHNSRITTTYGHLRRFARGVRAGVRVRQDQVIGYVGSTGLSTGPHLDYRVMRNGQFIDPLKLENPPTHPIADSDRARFEAHRDRLIALWAGIDPGSARPAPQLPDLTPRPPEGAPLAEAGSDSGRWATRRGESRAAVH